MGPRPGDPRRGVPAPGLDLSPSRSPRSRAPTDLKQLSYWHLYDLLVDRLDDSAQVAEIVIGLTWTLCRSTGEGGAGFGLAMSPGVPTRTLPWPGTLSGRPVRGLSKWLRGWDPYEATVAMAAVNSVLNRGSDLAGSAIPLFPAGAANLAVFQHFAPRLAGQRVCVVGRYPGLDALDLGWDLTVLERRPGPGDLPDPAAEYLLPRADWVFLTATSIPNKTFPRLAELSRDATLVLMGPTVPWVPELADFGVDYLAGVRVEDGERLRVTVAEGGGTRIFETGVRYAVADLRLCELDRLREAIAATAASRDRLVTEMESWYAHDGGGRFPGRDRLERLGGALSELDTRLKRTFDAAETAR